MKKSFKAIFKTFITCIFAFFVCFSFVACKNNPDNTSGDNPTIDVDLSQMSTTMMYSYVTNMIEKPSEFEGKYVKAKGIHQSFTDDTTNITYHAILIYDSSTCCSQALEFVLEDETNYPALDETITIEGTFGTYNEGGNTYCYLNQSKLS